MMTVIILDNYGPGAALRKYAHAVADWAFRMHVPVDNMHIVRSESAVRALVQKAVDDNSRVHVILSGSDLDPRPRFLRLVRWIVRAGGTCLAICYAMQCLAMDLGMEAVQLADAPRATRHVVDGRTVVSNHMWGIVAPAVVSMTDVRWYTRAGRRVMAEFRGWDGRVLATQYHPERGPALPTPPPAVAMAMANHREGAEWFGMGGEKLQVRAVTSCRGPATVRIVWMDHSPEDDPEFARRFPELYARLGQPDRSITVYKSWCLRKRMLPPPGHFPRPCDVNGGMHVDGADVIHVYRKEGSLKVALHEAVHMLGLELSLTVPDPGSVPGCVDGYRSPREAWVETEAIRAMGLDLKREREHVIQKCGAILVNTGYRRASDFLRPAGECAVTHTQESDVLAYYFIRAALLGMSARQHRSRDALLRATRIVGSKAFADEVQRAMVPRKGVGMSKGIAMTTVG